MKRNHKIFCPDAHCRGGYLEKQRPLTDRQLAKIPETDRLKIEPHRALIQICGYCGCVYKKAPNAIKFGFLDHDWVSASDDNNT